MDLCCQTLTVGYSISRFVEGLKSQQVQDFVITQIRNEKEEQHRDIPVQRVLEIVKTLEAEDTQYTLTSLWNWSVHVSVLVDSD